MDSRQLVVGGLLAAMPESGAFGGTRAAASGLLVWLVLLPLVGAVLPGWLPRRLAERVTRWSLLGTAGLAAYLLMARRELGVFDHDRAVVNALVQPLWQVLAVGRLQLAVGLILDRPAAALLAVGALVGAGCTADRRRAAWLAGGCAATAIALLGDSLVTRLIGWELLTVVGWALGRRRRRAALYVAGVGDATLLVTAALLFWALGGSWSSSRLDARYQLDFSPPHDAAGASAGVSAALGPTLELTSLRAQVHAPAPGEQVVAPARATLYNKLWLGGRLLTWLEILFGLAVALKALAGGLLIEREARWAERLWLGLTPGLCAAHLWGSLW